jgi:hypothetical protein
MFRLIRVFRPFRYNSTVLLCVLIFLSSMKALIPIQDNRSDVHIRTKISTRTPGNRLFHDHDSHSIQYSSVGFPSNLSFS